MSTRWRSAGTVAAVLFVGCTASPSEEILAPAPARPPDAPTENIRIEDLEIEEPNWKADGSDWRLRLSWQAPAGLTVDHYEVTRDGLTVDDAVDDAAFRDDDVEPGTRYRYSVVGVDADGGITRQAVATIKTEEPSLADARLEGSFVVRMVVERSSGTRNPVRGGAIFFAFDPSCPNGACSVRWTVRKARTEGTLRRDHAVYAARLRTPLFVRSCTGRVIDESLDVHLRVIAAAPLRHSWRATKIEGSIGEVSSSAGCTTASIDWSVRGALQN